MVDLVFTHYENLKLLEINKIINLPYLLIQTQQEILIQKSHKSITKPIDLSSVNVVSGFDKFKNFISIFLLLM